MGRDKLEALLTLEADRMQNSLIASAQLTSEKRVVISELQGYENSPSYRLNKAVMQAAFPNHPYGLPVGGTKADVEKFTVEQVKNYYQTYYNPANTTVVITGDFATESTLKAVKDTFGQVKPSAKKDTDIPVRRDAVNSPVGQKTPIILKQPGSAALLQAVYPLPNINHPDVPTIDVMDMILTSGRSSRLYQALVESGLASSVNGSAAELLEPGWYEINATAAPGQELSKITQVLQQTLLQLQQQPVTREELNRAKTQLQAGFILDNQDITSQASQLGYNQTIAGDYHFVEKYLAAIAQVTAKDVQKVAKTYLNPVKQTLGYFQPTQVDGQQADASGGSGRTVENFSPGEPVDPAELAKYLPAATSVTRRIFQQAIYPKNHPFYSFPTVTSLNSITRNDLLRFYQQHYRPDTTTIALVGDFEPEKVKALLNQTFGSWQAQGKPPILTLPVVELPQTLTRVNKVIPGKAEAVTYIGYNSISRRDPRFYAALVVNQILGGDTLSSRLGTEIRDRQGLTYGIYSAFAAGMYPGTFLIQMQTDPQDAEKAIASTLALLKQLRQQGITPAEFNTAKRSISNTYPVDLANPSDVADIILTNSIYGLSQREIRDFPQRIEAVTMAQVQQIIQELIKPDNVVIVTAGSGNGLKV